MASQARHKLDSPNEKFALRIVVLGRGGWFYDAEAKHWRWKSIGWMNWSLHPAGTFSIACCQLKLNEKGVEMDFRRGRCSVRLVAIHKSGAHEPAGRSRFSGYEHVATKNRGDVARGVLRLPFLRDEMAVVWPCRACVVVGGKRCEGGTTAFEFFRLAG
jgi:hypothetical protein